MPRSLFLRHFFSDRDRTVLPYIPSLADTITIKKEMIEYIDGGRPRLGAATTRALARIKQEQGDDEGAAAMVEEEDDDDIEAAAERTRRLSADVAALPEVADLFE